MTQKPAINSAILWLTLSTFLLFLCTCKDRDPSSTGGEGSDSAVSDSDQISTSPSVHALRPKSPPSRRVKMKPEYVIGPVAVRQVLVDPEGRALLTEEAEVSHCENNRRIWSNWMKCVDSILATNYGWLKRAAFKVRSRSVPNLNVLGRISYSGKPFRRLFDFRAGVALEAGNGKSAMVVHYLQKRDRKTIPRKVLAKGETIKDAVILPRDRILIVTVIGKRSPTATLKWIKYGAAQLVQASNEIRYKKKKFMAPNLSKMGMAARYLYVHCGASDKVACEQIKRYGGIPYARRLRRDRSVKLAATLDGSHVALYAFGGLYIYKNTGRDLKLERAWNDVFYVDKDTYLRNPGLVFDSSGRWLALTSSRRLNLIVDTQTERIRPVRDYTKPHSYVSLFNQGSRGAVFMNKGSQTVLLYGDLRGGLVSYNLQTRKKHRWQLPEAKGFDRELSEPELISYLQSIGDRLIAWRNGAVYILDSRTMRLRARIGTYAALGWSRRLSELSIP